VNRPAQNAWDLFSISRFLFLLLTARAFLKTVRGNVGNAR